MTKALDSRATEVAGYAITASRAEPATIPLRFALEAVASLPAGERARILALAGIDRAKPPPQRHRLTPDQFEQTYRASMEAAGDETVGYAARPMPIGSYAFVVRSLTHCATVAAALAQMCDFYRLFDPDGGYELSREGRVATLALRPATRAQAHSILFAMTMLLQPLRTIAWLCARSLPLSSATLPRRFHGFASQARYLLGAAPQVGGSASVRFDARVLDSAVVRSPADVPAYLAVALRGFLAGAAGDDIENGVRGVLATWRPFAGAGVEDVAKRLAMSRPTLARHLARIGTSFAAIRDEMRRDHAIAQLGRGVRIADVAERLGYSEPSAFQRAFKSWTGSSPRRYLMERGARDGVVVGDRRPRGRL